MPNLLQADFEKTLIKPFSVRFSPFSTVFSIAANRNSFDDSRVRPFSGSPLTV